MGATAAWLKIARRDRRFAIASVMTLLSLLAWPLIYAYLVRIGVADSFHHGDFGAYRITVNAWLDGGPIYEEPYFGGWLYPPVYLLAFVPFASGEFSTAAWVWTIGSVLALWLALQALIASYGLPLRWFERIILLWAIVGFQPILYGMRLGQASMAIAAIMTLALAAFEYDNRHRNLGGALVAGALTAVAGSVKLFYAPAGAHLLHDSRRFAGAMIAGVVLGGVSLLVFGVDSNLAYLDVLRWGEDWGRDPRHPRLWFPGYYRPFYVIADFALVIRAALLIGILALVVWTRSTDGDREAFALGIVAIPLLGPQVSVHDFAVVLPAVVALLWIEFVSDGRPIVPVIALLLLHIQAYGVRVLVSIPPSIPGGSVAGDWAPLLQPALYGNLLLLGLAAYRLYVYRPIPPFERIKSMYNRNDWN